VWCPRQESNLYHSLRRGEFYPLNYGGQGQDCNGPESLKRGGEPVEGGDEWGWNSVRDSQGLAVQQEVLHVIQGFLYTSPLEKQFEAVQILAVNQKRSRAIDTFGHARFQL
jgi:hypothetical protein